MLLAEGAGAHEATLRLFDSDKIFRFPEATEEALEFLIVAIVTGVVYYPEVKFWKVRQICRSG